MNDTIIDKIINAFASISDYFALKNRDWRVQNNTNEGGNLVYLPGYSYESMANVAIVITATCFVIALIFFIINTLHIFDNLIWGFAFTLGIMFLIISLPVYFATIYRKNMGEKLKTGQNTKISATVVKIKRTYFPAHMGIRTGVTIKYTNPFPYIIIADWKNSSGKDYLFKSLLLANDPSTAYKIGSSINVYLDSNNYKRYYVDTGNLF